jgi:uncharacterized protein YecT (DUF1311 family)
MLIPNPSLFAAALLAALWFTPAQAETVAWYDDAYRQCAESSTQGIVECIAAQTEDWDQRLNAAYGALMKQQSGERRTALRDVQRVWIRYRDANCGFYAAAEGTISRIAAAECLRVMTAARALELELAAQP